MLSQVVNPLSNIADRIPLPGRSRAAPADAAAGELRTCRRLPGMTDWSRWEPPVGIEPTTFALQERCSTTELRRRSQTCCARLSAMRLVSPFRLPTNTDHV